MIRGEYEVNGVIVPNHFTNIGMQTILRATFGKSLSISGSGSAPKTRVMPWL